MSFEINFRKAELSRLRVFVVITYATSFVILLGLLGMAKSTMAYSSHISTQQSYLNKLREMKNELALSLDKLKGNNEPKSRLISELPVVLDQYRGRPPVSVLYDLEKSTPDNVLVTSVSYDRSKAKAVVEAVCKKQEDVAKMLLFLERVEQYKKVTLLNQIGVDGGDIKVSYELADGVKGGGNAK